MKRVLPILSSLFIGMLCLPANTQAAKRHCYIAQKLARQVKSLSAKLKRDTYYAKRLHNKYSKTTRPGTRTTQKPIVIKFDQHFRSGYRSKWKRNRLKRSFVLRFLKTFTRFKADLTKLRSSGYKLNSTKLQPKGAFLYTPDPDSAPCGTSYKYKGKFTKNSAAFKALARYFSSSKLRKMLAMKAFLLKMQKAQLQSAITKTKAIIAAGKTIKRLVVRIRRNKKSLRRARLKLRRYARLCLGGKKVRRIFKRRASLTKNTEIRRCEADQEDNQQQSMDLTQCFGCNFAAEFDSADSDAGGAIGGVTTAGFEGNFLTGLDAMVETDEAFNDGAESAYGSLSGL